MRNLLSLAFAGCVLTLTAGCGNNSNPNVSKVKGTITYNSQPVKGGVIRFISANGTGMSMGPIMADGSYEIVDLPPGKMAVVLETESMNPNRKMPSYGGKKGADKQLAERMKATGTSGALGGEEVSAVNPAAKKELAERYVKIPVKYTMEKTTPLITELQAGWNTYDITLSD